MSTIHVAPVHDLIKHDVDGGDCPCGSTTEPVMRADGSNGWLVVHHSLDGREGRDDPCPECFPWRSDARVRYRCKEHR